MKKIIALLLWTSMLAQGKEIIHLFIPQRAANIHLGDPLEDLQQEAFQILNEKCNVCHRKKNPFMVFNQKNMKKRADRIFQAVFVEQRMPKGEDIRLSKEEYATLKSWLNTQNIQ